MQDNLTIREAETKDVFALTELMNELGYNTTESEMWVRFSNIYNHNDYKTFVATIDTRVVGIVGLTRNYSYEQNGIYARVVALVINYEFRQNGIGKRLMKTAEQWAKDIGADKVLLNCGNREERKIAHLFYQKIGYEIKSSGFIKRI